MCVSRAHLVAELAPVPRAGAAPPQFDGRGAQQAPDAAADRSVRGHRAVSRRLAAALSGCSAPPCLQSRAAPGVP